uniref:Uncharacterized protein n=1 Tax=Ralstonia solanacearum TaxID=305 RepID=A0A0S4U4X3_RALSL|nr:protein of unknown function [Ralstonia solanacearum]CUV30428.1 protein of unknown function [Ralstonia solanacearum]
MSRLSPGLRTHGIQSSRHFLSNHTRSNVVPQSITENACNPKPFTIFALRSSQPRHFYPAKRSNAALAC